MGEPDVQEASIADDIAGKIRMRGANEVPHLDSTRWMRSLVSLFILLFCTMVALHISKTKNHVAGVVGRMYLENTT